MSRNVNVNVNGINVQMILAQAMSEKLGLNSCNLQEYRNLDRRLRKLTSMGRKLGIPEKLIEDSFAFSCRLYEEASDIQWVVSQEKPYDVETRYVGDLYEWVSVKFAYPRSADSDLDIKSLNDFDQVSSIVDVGRDAVKNFIDKEQECEDALIKEWAEELSYINYDKLSSEQQSSLWECIPPFVAYRVCCEGKTICNSY